MSKRLLILEDEVLIAWDIEAEMKARGWTIVGPASTIEQAIAMAGSEPLDAALLDVNLGKQTSFEAARALDGRGVAVVFLTGYARDVLPQDLQRIPVQSKPIRFDRLDAALNAAVARVRRSAAS